MAESNEIRRLTAKWKAGTGWPKRLDWIQIGGLRGWAGQRFKLDYPIMAVVGENGSGKSTVLQCAASVYKSPNPEKGWFASDFLPDTTWDRIRNASIRYAVREGTKLFENDVRKPGERWRGNPERRERSVVYIDLSRVQPVSARVGYWKLANPQHTEKGAMTFDPIKLARFSQIMGRQYDQARMALTDQDEKRSVSVIRYHQTQYSGFHQGGGEMTIAELLEKDLPQYSLVLVDEVETSLHPRSQRRLIRDLAERCRERELQIILSTHSPFILDELPLEARAQIFQSDAGKTVVYGVSPEFAMSKMDDVPQYECELFMEDRRAQALIVETLFRHAPHLVTRCRTVPYGAASVGLALGIMTSQGRYPRPACVFLDGDQGTATGCVNLPGDDAPERVVFDCLKAANWGNLAARTGRNFSDVADACSQAMLLQDHHDWVKAAANVLVLSSDILWQAMCAEWAVGCLAPQDAKSITQPIEDALIGVPYTAPAKAVVASAATTPGIPPTPMEVTSSSQDSSEPWLPFEQS